MMPFKKNDKQLADKIERYCAYQERCRQDVRIKLKQIGADDSEIESLISRLEENGFINESRYAKAFARDKFNLHRWGKIKIGIALQGKNVPQKLIDESLAEIEDAEYRNELKVLLKKKGKELSDLENDFVRKNRLASYLIGKGFEPDIVWDLINER